MGYSELVTALKQKEEAKVESVWKVAREEAKKIEKDTALRLDEIQSQAASAGALKDKSSQKSILAKAHQKASDMRALAMQKLADDIENIGLKILPLLREDNYEKLFIILTKELPTIAWEEIRVNPADELLAKRFFPDETIVCDSTIVGGLEVSSNDGRLRIVNTLEKRLEKGWGSILPSIINELMVRVT